MAQVIIILPSLVAKIRTGFEQLHFFLNFVVFLQFSNESIGGDNELSNVSFAEFKPLENGTITQAKVSDSFCL